MISVTPETADLHAQIRPERVQARIVELAGLLKAGLKDAGATGTVGPNLDDAKPPLALVVDRVTNGKAPMPAFAGQLTPQQIQDVASYVVQATKG